LVSGRYDSLLAKLVIVGANRNQALERARRALAEFQVIGVDTVLPFFRDVVDDPAFAATTSDDFTIHTRWIEEHWLPQAERAPPATMPDVFAVQVGGRWMGVELPGLLAAKDGPLHDARHQALQRPARAVDVASDEVVSPMQGTVVEVMVSEGQHVRAGDLLAVVEAMKMENPLRAPRDGWITNLAVAKGDGVAQGAAVCRLDPRIE
jgi:acetyl-CoA/propionyl-CoA carboxylase biotin carboxyl carrier protein